VNASARFRLHEEAGVFGVIDAAGPQLYFAETRERAVREVDRANRIVALYPNAISMRHLREMDSAWRQARGVPVPSEPAGKRIRVADPTAPEQGVATGARSGGDGSEATEVVAGARAEVSRALELARQAAARRSLEDRIAAEARVLRTAVRIEREAGAVQQGLAPVLHRLRRALSTVCGERAEEAEAALWRAAGRRGVGEALPPLRAIAAAFHLPGTDPRAPDARDDEELAAALERCAPLLVSVAQVLESGAERGVAPLPATDLPPDVRLELFRDTARASGSTARSALANLRELYRSSPIVSGQLHREWLSLGSGERDVVRSAVPGVDDLLGGRRGTPSRSPRAR
jgi:hypothetical protein